MVSGSPLVFAEPKVANTKDTDTTFDEVSPVLESLRTDTQAM
jgi:hypothetical protein